MSRTKPSNNVSNPAVATFEWSAMDGNFTAWDSVNKEKVVLTDKIRFAVLDQLSNLSGWVKELGSCRSHETHNISSAPLQVFAWKDGKSRMIKEGAYKDIKDEMKAMGVKYHKVVYAMLLADVNGIPDGSIIKLDLGGAAMSEWIEVGVKDDWAVEVGEPEEVQINKMIKYMKPTFKQIDLSESEERLADDADGELQAFFSARKTPPAVVETQEEEPDPDIDEEIPF